MTRQVQSRELGKSVVLRPIEENPTQAQSFQARDNAMEDNEILFRQPRNREWFIRLLIMREVEVERFKKGRTSTLSQHCESSGDGCIYR